MFKDSIRNFQQNLEGLSDFVELVGPFIESQGKEIFKKHEKYIACLMYAFSKLNPDEFSNDGISEERLKEKYNLSVKVEITEKSKDKKAAKLHIESPDPDFKDDSNSFLNEYQKNLHRTPLLYRNSLITLISTVEWFFSELLHIYYDKFPEINGSSEKQFSIEDLKSFQSIDDARKYLIDKKIEGILRSSFKEWIDFLKTRIKLSMGYLKDSLDLCLETCERRNLLVHNNGIVNSIYLAKVNKNLTKEIKIGDTIEIDKSYLFERIDLFEHNCLLIAGELWKKISPNDSTRANILNDAAYECMLKKRWKISEGLCKFVMNDKKTKEIIQVYGKLNYWLSLKRQNKWTPEIEKEIQTQDFSAKDMSCQLGWFALCDNKVDFFKLLPKALNSGDMTEKYLKEFPIFEELRNDKRMSKYFKVKKVAKKKAWIKKKPLAEKKIVKKKAIAVKKVAKKKAALKKKPIAVKKVVKKKVTSK